MGQGARASDFQDMPGHLIRRLQQGAVAVVISKLAEHGFDLTPVQFAAMKALSAHPGVDQASLAALIAYDRATIGGVVERLVQKGLVGRAVSQSDRRARTLTLSPTGRSVLQKVEPLVRDAQAEILGGLPEHERQAFTEALRRCVDALNDRTRVPAKRQKGE